MEFPTIFSITEDEIDLNDLLAKITLTSTGAAAIFTGMVRGKTTRGESHETDYLEYEAYREMAIHKMQQVADEVREKWAIDDIAMLHRIGHLEVGERSVAIAVGAPHRKVAFEACEYAIDRLKEIVPIWKKEFYEDGAEWKTR